jgi:hypothetical protein
MTVPSFDKKIYVGMEYHQGVGKQPVFSPRPATTLEYYPVHSSSLPKAFGSLKMVLLSPNKSLQLLMVVDSWYVELLLIKLSVSSAIIFKYSYTPFS